MKNRLYLVCGVLVVAAGVGLLWRSPWEPREPVYDGKPLSYWLINGHPEGLVRIKVPASLLHDSNTVPLLVGALSRRDRPWDRAYLGLLEKIPGALDRPRSHLPLPFRNAIIRGNALCVLSRMGPMAEPAVPAIIRVLKADDIPEIRSEAASALLQIDPAAAAKAGVKMPSP
jgi:hypothetical protein